MVRMEKEAGLFLPRGYGAEDEYVGLSVLGLHCLISHIVWSEAAP